MLILDKPTYFGEAGLYSWSTCLTFHTALRAVAVLLNISGWAKDRFLYNYLSCGYMYTVNWQEKEREITDLE